MKVIFGVTGSIAAYKAVDIARQIQAIASQIKIVLSKGSLNFVTKQTWQSFFGKEVFVEEDAFIQENGSIAHIKLAKDADVVVIAPASANIIARLAGGFADSLLCGICLATKAKILLVPAMNANMWTSPAVQQNIAKLITMGIEIIPPIYGQQACGDIGFGKMADILSVSARLLRLSNPMPLRNKKVVITVGATLEHIDPVRFISNGSSGKMGFAIAKAAFEMGAEVTAIVGSVSIEIPPYIIAKRVKTAEEMLISCKEECKDANIVIGCAAVADYKAKNRSFHKIKKQNAFSIDLEKNSDVIAIVKELYPHLIAVGFAAETENFMENALSKLKNKDLDIVVLNDVAAYPFGSDESELHVMTRGLKYHHICKQSKESIGKELLRILASDQ